MSKKRSPTKTGAKSFPLQVRISSELKALIEQAAAKDRRSISDWARLRLEDAAKRELGTS